MLARVLVAASLILLTIGPPYNFCDAGAKSVRNSSEISGAGFQPAINKTGKLKTCLSEIASNKFLNTALYTSNAVHPISVTEASVFVTRTKAILRIQMFAEDLILFQGLQPNDQDRVSPEDLKR